jgi:hypothetical protein
MGPRTSGIGSSVPQCWQRISGGAGGVAQVGAAGGAGEAVGLEPGAGRRARRRGGGGGGAERRPQGAGRTGGGGGGHGGGAHGQAREHWAPVGVGSGRGWKRRPSETVLARAAIVTRARLRANRNAAPRFGARGKRGRGVGRPGGASGRGRGRRRGRGCGGERLRDLGDVAGALPALLALGPDMHLAGELAPRHLAELGAAEGASGLAADGGVPDGARPAAGAAGRGGRLLRPRLRGLDAAIWFAIAMPMPMPRPAPMPPSPDGLAAADCIASAVANCW